MAEEGEKEGTGRLGRAVGDRVEVGKGGGGGGVDAVGGQMSWVVGVCWGWW